MNPNYPGQTYPAANTAYTGNNYTAGGVNAAAPGAGAGAAALPGPAPNTAGPHRHDILNKLDPRVDSDMSNVQAVANVGRGGRPVPVGPAAGHAMGGGAMGGGAVGAAGGVPEGSYGPHSSRLGNALDPRVDSDADGHGMGRGPAAPGAGMGAGLGAGMAPGHHTHGTHGTHGTHHNHLGHHQNVGGLPGPAPNTAGPHRSDLLNKLDPAVQSQPAAGGAYAAPGSRVV